jgi:hypothetical protein
MPPVPAGASVSFNWTAATALPAGSTHPGALSCPTTTFCMAATSGGSAIVMSNGFWHSPGTQLAQTDASLVSVSCVSTSFCMASGAPDDTVWRYDGTWSAADQLSSSGSDLFLQCTSASFCLGVDFSGNSFEWNGSSWSYLGSVGFPSVADLSCSGPSQCVVVGDFGLSNVWNGTGWGAASQLNQYIGFDAVACSAVNYCLAVSDEDNSYTWNGSGWSGPTAVGGTIDVLASLTCVSSTFCLTDLTPAGIISWNGSSWSTVDSPETGNGIGSISCVTTTFCAVLTGNGSAYTPAVNPTVTGVIPAAGPVAGGTIVKIFGTSFTSGSTVVFGSTAATGVAVDSANEIQTTVPASVAGPVNIRVTTPIGTSPFTAVDIYTYGTVATAEPYNPVSPTRLCDTRSGQPDPGCPGATTLGPGGTLTVQAEGVVGVPSTGVSAVVVNVTVTNTTSQSYLAAYPAGEYPPNSSNLNWPAGRTIANLVTVGLSSTGAFSVYNHSGSVDVVIDLAGYFAAAAVGSGLYEPLAAPARICDTRAGNPSGLTGTATQCEGKAPANGSFVAVQVLGVGGVPASGVGAVVLNVTAVTPTSNGHLTVYPDGETAPLASNVNFRPGAVVPNRVIVPVGSDGDVDVLSSAGNPEILVDVAGWFTGDSNASATGDLFTPALAPTRICDTRTTVDYITGCTGRTLTGGKNVNEVYGDVDEIPATAEAVVMNATVTNATASGYLAIYPFNSSGGSPPTVSDLNWSAGTTVANMAIATLEMTPTSVSTPTTVPPTPSSMWSAGLRPHSRPGWAPLATIHLNTLKKPITWAAPA